MNVLLLHRDLSIQNGINKMIDECGLRGGRTTPLARARGTGDAPAREAEGVPVALVVFNTGLLC
jgi:hypothetical protein